MIVEIVIAVHTTQRKLVEGRCCVCGCTEENACRGGCSWADLMRLLCTSCLARAEPEGAGVLPLGPISVRKWEAPTRQRG